MKTIVKVREGMNFLVTGGPFRWLRHQTIRAGDRMDRERGGGGRLMAILERRVVCESRRAVARRLARRIGGHPLCARRRGDPYLRRSRRRSMAGVRSMRAWVKGSWAGPMVRWVELHVVVWGF